MMLHSFYENLIFLNIKIHHDNGAHPLSSGDMYSYHNVIRAAGHNNPHGMSSGQMNRTIPVQAAKSLVVANHAFVEHQILLHHGYRPFLYFDGYIVSYFIYFVKAFANIFAFYCILLHFRHKSIINMQTRHSPSAANASLILTISFSAIFSRL